MVEQRPEQQCCLFFSVKRCSCVSPWNSHARYLENIFGENFFEKIIFTEETGEDDKEKIAQNLGCDIVIDDAAHHIERYKKSKNLQIIQFLKGWNNENENHERVKVVKNWLEIADFVENFSK